MTVEEALVAEVGRDGLEGGETAVEEKGSVVAAG